jgi:hypothetical protein
MSRPHSDWFVGPGALTGAPVAASGMRLTGRLIPDHKTIADFRKDNGGAIRQSASGLLRSVAPWADRVQRGDQRQQVQGGEQPGQELHSRQDGPAHGADWHIASFRWKRQLGRFRIEADIAPIYVYTA